MRNILIAAMLSAALISLPAASFAGDGEVKLSKAERKALDGKQNKLGRLSQMCIGGLAMSSLDDNDIRESDAYKASVDFWVANLDKSLTHLKEKKRAKRRDLHRVNGSNSLKRLGNGNIIAGGKQAKVICDMMQAEGLDGPTAKMML